MRKPDFNSLNFKVWGYIMAFSMAILLLLWLMQIAFLNVYYQSMKQASVTSAAGKIASLYGHIQGQELKSQMQNLANDSDVFINILDTDGQSLFSIDPVGRDYRTPLEHLGETDPNIPQLPAGVATGDASNDNGNTGDGKGAGTNGNGNGGNGAWSPYHDLAQRILQDADHMVEVGFDDQNGRRMLILGRQIATAEGEQALMVVSSPVQPLTETAKILSRQLVYITIAILAMSILVSVVIARRVSQPITRIRDGAMQLARGRYDTTFEHGMYSEVNQLADTLNHTAKALQQVETLRTELIANVSHDLRTPLTMIRVYAEMIRDLYANNAEKRNRNVGVIIEECDRLTSLVQNLLDLSKLQSGVDTLAVDSFDLTETIRRILRRYDALEQDGYHIRFAQSKPVLVTGDEGRIEQVLYNLINNAVNYTGPDKRIDLMLADHGDRVRVLVADTGPGIATEDRTHIWDRYYKVDKVHQRAVTGSGLGLSIVRSIMDLHGMACGVDSIVGQGSTFWFELNKEGEG